MLVPQLFSPRPAHAQRSTPILYILDFNNETTVGGALLGRVAAASVALQLADSPGWEVLPEAQVQQAIQQLNLKPPFDRPDRVAIANRLEANAVAYGKVTEARVTTGSNPQATVTIEVVIEDITTGVLMNGAMTTGTSTTRMGFTGDADVLLEEALGKAAFKAREALDRFRLPEGTVLNTTVVGTPDKPELDALLNIGVRAGIRRGMHLVITRQREPVGIVKVTSVDAEISTGRVVQNLQGVRPEDRARAIFSFADFPPSRAKIRASGDGGVQLASRALPKDADAAAQPGVAKISPKDTFVQLKAEQPDVTITQDTVQKPPPVVVDEPDVNRTPEKNRTAHSILGGGALKMLAGGALLLGILAIGGRGGEDAARPQSIEAFAYQFDVGTPGAFIRVKWERPNSIRHDFVLQYIVFRHDEIGNFTVVNATQGDVIRTIIDSEATGTATNVFNGSPGGDAGTQATITNIPGIQPGQQYRYQVATVYESQLEDRDNDGTPDTANFISPLTSSTKWITAIAPPVITAIDNQLPSAGQAVQLNNIPVTWQQTPGADTYVVWVSREPNFRGKRISSGPYHTVPVDQGGPLTVTRTIDASGFGSSHVVYISVGARNAHDPRPRPFGAIFSAPISVTNQENPPPPPSQGGAARKHGKGEGGKGKGGGRIDDPAGKRN